MTPVCWDAPAKGDETKGRGEIVNEADKTRNGFRIRSKRGKKDLPIVNRVDRMRRVVYSKARGGKHEKY